MHLDPHLGRYFLGPALAPLREAVSTVRPHVVIWTHSYLAAAGMRAVGDRILQVVEFANLEVQRSRSLAGEGAIHRRALRWVEHAKATRWEKRVMREAQLCIALTPRDASVIKPFAKGVILAQNGIPQEEYFLSPSTASLLAVGNWNYVPNASAMRTFLEFEWPKLLKRIPEAHLKIVGAGSLALLAASPSDHVSAYGFVPELADAYRTAAIVLAPAATGAGSQLKVTEALGFGRVVVGPPYLGNERRPGMPTGALSASTDIASEIARLLDDVDGRHQIENDVRIFASQHSWEDEMRTLVASIVSLADSKIENGSPRPAS